MNSYLIQIANDLPQLRKILSLTQKDLAEELGISRPTLVKIEQSPDRLTKIIALGLYVIANAHLTEDFERIQVLKSYSYEDKEDMTILLKNLSKFNTITKANISGVASSTIPLNIFQSSFGFLGSSISGLLKNLPNIVKQKNKKEEVEDNKYSDVTLDDIEITEALPGAIDKFLRGIEEQIDSKNRSCLELLGLEEWNTNIFLETIEKGTLN